MAKPLRFGDPLTPSREWAEAWPRNVCSFIADMVAGYRERVWTYHSQVYGEEPDAFLLASPVEIVAVGTLGWSWIFAHPADQDTVRVLEAWEHEELADWDFVHAPSDHRMHRTQQLMLEDSEWYTVEAWEVRGSMHDPMPVPRFDEARHRGAELADLEASGVALQRVLEGERDAREEAPTTHRLFGARVQPDPNLCFVLMPFREEFNEVWQDVIQKTVSEMGLKCLRADDIYGPRPIMHDIWSHIAAARVLIAELSGQNANVFYELGLAHAIEKEVVMLTQRIDDVPFDLRHLRVLQYTTTGRGLAKLGDDLQKMLDEVLKKGAVNRRES